MDATMRQSHIRAEATVTSTPEQCFGLGLSNSFPYEPASDCSHSNLEQGSSCAFCRRFQTQYIWQSHRKRGIHAPAGQPR